MCDAVGSHNSGLKAPLASTLNAGTLARAYANWYATKDKSKQVGV